MRLAFDIGNTFAKWGFVHDGAVVGGGRAVHRGRGVDAALNAIHLERVPKSVVAVNVAGPVARDALAGWSRSRFGLEVVFVDATTPAKRVHPGYRDPARMGADRWAALVGAFHLHGACVVADLGTACTVDAVDGAGRHRGGFIAPGLDLMRGALRSDTAAVDVPDVEVPPGTWGRATEDAVAAGTRRALAGLVAGAVRELADPNAQLILTGGDADRIAPWLGVPHRVDRDIVLRGAVLLAEGAA